MAEKLQANLLGGVQFIVDDNVIANPPARVGQALLVYLLHQSRPVAREQLMDWFFQENDPQQARTNLRATLSRIKKQIGDVLDANRAEVWVRDNVEVRLDSTEFSTQTSNLQSTLASYHGDFLAGFFLRDAPEFEQWMVVERERLRLLAIDGFQQLVQQLTASAEFRPALDAANRLLAIEPLLENTQRQRLLLLARTGQRALALRAYNTLVELFDEELGVPLSAETESIYQRILNLPDQPPLKLPTQRRAFIGRTSELDQLQAALQAPSRRLITLVGHGGMGKTRLAQEAAQRLHAEHAGLFLDGIHFVALAAANSAEAAATQIAQTLNIGLFGQQPATEQLLNRLADQELLLILDNFEQLVDAAATFVVDLIDGCATLKLLVTSRERLNLYEETVLEVSGMQTPAEQDEAATAVETSEAVQLFVSNLEQQRLGFQPTEQEVQQVGAACRLLAGVPLGIELAASWSRQHAIADIVTEIQRGLDFLATSMRNVPERQRSLRAVFMHSWALLSAELQHTLTALAVFPSSFARADAVAIVGCSDDDLSALADKSLLQYSDDNRLAQHPLLRQFALELLQESEDRAAAQFTAHSHFFAERMEADADAIRGSRKVEITASMLVELDNIRQAWRTVSKIADSEQLQKMTYTLHRFYDSQHYYAEALAAFEETAEQYELVHGSAETIPTAILVPYCTVLSRIGWYNFRLGNFERARQWLEQATVQLRRIDAPAELAMVLTDTATVVRYMNQFEYVKALQAEALALHQQVGNVYAATVTMTTQAYVARDEGRFTDAWQIGVDAMEQINHDEHWQLVVNLLKMLGSVAARMGQHDEAIKFNKQALDLSIKHNHLTGQIEAHYQIAGVAFRIDDYATAKKHLEACEVGLESIDDPIRMVYVQLLWANVANDLEDIEQAVRSLKMAGGILANRQHVTLRFTLLQAIAHLALSVEHAPARDWLRSLLSEQSTPIQLRQQIESVLGDGEAGTISAETALAQARRWLDKFQPA